MAVLRYVVYQRDDTGVLEASPAENTASYLQ